MTQDQFNTAMAAIVRHHTTQLTLNSPLNGFVGVLGSHEFTIHITKCCPALVNDLVKLGYSLGMDDRGLNVTKI